MDLKFWLALLTPSIGFAIWFVKREIDARRAAQEKLAHQQNLVRALFAEIDFNTRDMRVFLEQSPSQTELRRLLEADPKLVPHITDARHTQIYRSRIGDIHTISDQILHQLIDFYGLLEKIRSQIEGVNYPSYLTVSAAGRANAVDVIRRTAAQAHGGGLALLLKFQSEYPELHLERFERDLGAISDEHLKQRLQAVDTRIAAARTGQVTR